MAELHKVRLPLSPHPAKLGRTVRPCLFPNTSEGINCAETAAGHLFHCPLERPLGRAAEIPSSLRTEFIESSDRCIHGLAPITTEG